MIKQWSYNPYSLFTSGPLRKMVGTANPLTVIGDRKGALKVLKIKLGGYKRATDGGNQCGGGGGSCAVTGEIVWCLSPQPECLNA